MEMESTELLPSMIKAEKIIKSFDVLEEYLILGYL
jgi:hypothetical protein